MWNNKTLEIPHIMKIQPICSESFGVRSFCIHVTTPDISILLDPGCALGPYKKFKIPHKLEYERLTHYTNKIVNKSRECNFFFISHYHHDHYKPNLSDEMYIDTSQKLFKSLYSGKKVICKQYRNNTNQNQKQRGEKLHHDLTEIEVRSIRVGRDSFPEDSSFYQRNSHLSIKSEITDSFMIGDTHFIFPREFLHGIRMDGKEIYIQPVIIIYKRDFFYFFPDVQGIPSQRDYNTLIKLRNEFTSIYHQFISDEISTHTIALGGPISFLLRKQNAGHLLEQSIGHTQRIAHVFDRVILDHHLIRDPEFQRYWRDIQTKKENVVPFNTNLWEELKKEKEQIPVLEFNRGRLYQQYPN